MKKRPKVSIIIPLYKKTPYFFESVGRCLELDYPDFEIIIGVDGKTEVSYQDKKIRILRSGNLNTGPAEKRDIGIRSAEGDYVAFLDDDSYPEKDWLKQAVSSIKGKKVAAVCGPGLTPVWDSFSQKITGAILGSFFGSGPYVYRFARATERYVEDYPAYNMLVNKNVLKKIGGFGTKFYGGEDTALCLKIINAGEKILYDPKMVVYHHRRHFPFEYMRQIGNVGLHRGYFVKAYPKTSFRVSYFLPTLVLAVLLVLFFVVCFNPPLRPVVILGCLMVYFAIFIEGVWKKTGLIVSLFLPLAIVVSHFSYGINFVKGLIFINKLAR